MKNKAWILLITVLAITNLYLFWPGNLYFLNDDLLHIPLTDVGSFLQTNSVRPVHELLVRLDLMLWNKNAFGYHLTSLVLQAIVCFQLFHFMKVLQVRWLKISPLMATQASFLAVVLFLIYPQSSETLGWILGRGPILAAIFFLITARLLFNKNIGYKTYALGGVCFIISLFTYEQILLFPFAVFSFSLMQNEMQKRKNMAAYSFVLAITAIAYLVIRFWVSSEVVGQYEGDNFLHFRIATLAANGLRLFGRLWLNPSGVKVFLCSLVLLVATLIALFFYCKRTINNLAKPVLFLALNSLLLLIPVMSLGVSISSFESGRYLYLPSLFALSTVAIIVVQLYHNNRTFRRPVCIGIAILLAYWSIGKVAASNDYKKASQYARQIHQDIISHFLNTSDTLHIDTLQATVKKLPVFRLGFKTGAKWLNNGVDTNKIVVTNLVDETARATF